MCILLTSSLWLYLLLSLFFLKKRVYVFVALLGHGNVGTRACKQDNLISFRRVGENLELQMLQKKQQHKNPAQLKASY